MGGISETITLQTVSHPKASVTVTVWSPADKLLACLRVDPLLHR
jgi:hypothetical protein